MLAAIQRKLRLCARGFLHDGHRVAFMSIFALTFLLSLCGIVFIMNDVLPPEYHWTASCIMILNGVVVFLSELRARSFHRNIALFFWIALSAFCIEFIGVNTAIPFGTYSYAELLQPKLHGIPLAIVFVWYTTVMTTWRLAQWLHGELSALRVALTAGVLTLALDVALEPMAAFVNRYWIWEMNQVPSQNYASWFVIGATAVFILVSFERKPYRLPGPATNAISLVGGIVYAMQFTLFALTDLVHGHAGATAIALLFLAVAVLSHFRHRMLFSVKG